MYPFDSAMALSSSFFFFLSLLMRASLAWSSSSYAFSIERDGFEASIVSRSSSSSSEDILLVVRGGGFLAVGVSATC